MKNNFFLATIIISALVAFASVDVAAEKKQPQNSSKEVIAGVQAKYEKTTDIRASFEQVTTMPGGRRLQASGQAFFKKPNMIRWDFVKPEAQAIITDGRTMWLYEPTEKQVQVYDAKMLDARLRMGFFSDLRRLEEDFTICMGGLVERCNVLELEPKPDRGLDMRHITLLISVNPTRVVEARVTDATGNLTTIKFSAIKENTGIKDSVFKFSPPAGVRVIKPAMQGLGL
ncbi:MAG: outer membrane lipoprotein carrier protein LolA [Pseudomonadota bacterium]